MLVGADRQPNEPALQRCVQFAHQVADVRLVVQLLHFKKGERIITKGEKGNVLYIIKSGTGTLWTTCHFYRWGNHVYLLVVCSDAGDGNTMESVRISVRHKSSLAIADGVD